MGAPHGSLSGLRVLVVEDNLTSLAVLARLLERLGCEVLRAVSVAEACALIGALGQNVDVLISDIGLPDGSGHEVMQAARRLLPHLRGGIALSGFGSDEDMQRSRYTPAFPDTSPSPPASASSTRHSQSWRIPRTGASPLPVLVKRYKRKRSKLHSSCYKTSSSQVDLIWCNAFRCEQVRCRLSTIVVIHRTHQKYVRHKYSDECCDVCDKCRAEDPSGCLFTDDCTELLHKNHP